MKEILTPDEARCETCGLRKEHFALRVELENKDEGYGLIITDLREKLKKAEKDAERDARDIEWADKCSALADDCVKREDERDAEKARAEKAEAEVERLRRRSGTRRMNDGVNASAAPEKIRGLTRRRAAIAGSAAP